MAEINMSEIDIVSSYNGELYCYIGQSARGKTWPTTIVHKEQTYIFEAYWDLPAQMKTYVQAARYLVSKP